MTSISPNVAAGTAGASTATTSALAKTSADFDMFLKMLTTQMQNQDPLNPMDTAQYTQQLVQYSQVEQSIQQTGTLRDILARLSTQDMAQSASFIGREGTFDTNISGLSATAPAQWAFAAERPVSSLLATVTDGSGAVVDTRPVDPAASGRFSWDGKLSNGRQAPVGSYSLSIAGADFSGGTVPIKVHSVGTIKQVIAADGAVSLGVNGTNLPVGKLITVSSAND